MLGRKSVKVLKNASILLLSGFTSCISLHTPSTHFVPSIVDRKQFEGEVSLGAKSAGVNFAYSPLKHLSLLGNVQSLPFKTNSSNFQRNCELAVGTYLPVKKCIYGFNLGYGMGAYDWNYTLMNDSAFYALHTRGNYKKFMGQVFVSFANRITDPTFIGGFSVKANFFWDQYESLKATNQNNDYKGWQNNTSVEPCVFVRSFFNKRIYLHGQAGVNISYDKSMFWPTQYVFARVGCGIKL